MLRCAWGVMLAVAASARPVSGAAPAPKPESDVKLSLSTPTTHGTWTMRVTNDGDVPVRLAADARVLSLDVTPRGARRPVRCGLPEDMRPQDGDLDRPLVLPPGRSYVESFEARLYCFGEARGAALAPGAIVVARLGWAGRHPAGLAVSPIDGVEPRIVPEGELEAPPVVLPDEPAPAPATPQPREEVDAQSEEPHMSLTEARWVDVEYESGLEVPVSLRNTGTHAVVVRFRPDDLRFDIVGPSGVAHCGWPVLPGAPTREQFTTLAPRASTALVATLLTYCSTGTFDRPGLYVVRAHADMRSPSGAPLGIHAYEGDLFGTDATVVRLHHGRAATPATRPRLEEP
jgi:hypothetical protein